MPFYNFESITAAQALSFTHGVDTLVFAAGDVTGTLTSVGFSSSGVAITAEGRTVVFALGSITQNDIHYTVPGSFLLIGTNGADTLQGGGSLSGQFGGPGNDLLTGAGLQNGGAGADTLQATNATFAFDPGESLATQSGMDVINNYTRNDQLSFNGLVGVGAGLAKGDAANFDAALAFANQKIATGTVDVVSVTVGSDVIVFVDDKNDNGTADDAVLLKGADPLDVFASLFVGTGHVTPTPPAGQDIPTPLVVPPSFPSQPFPQPGPTYHFETITEEQAAGYSAHDNALVFDSFGLSAAETYVWFNPATATFTVKSLFATRQTATFGTGLAGERVIFADGSDLYIGTNAGEFIAGRTGNDGLYGAAGDDSLSGEEGNDVLDGGPGADTLKGGAGGDHFFVRPGESGVVAGHTDIILDWESSDTLHIRPNGNGGTYKLTASNFAEGLALANDKILHGGGQVVAVQIGADVVVFADTNGDFIAADDAVVLKGRTLADINAALNYDAIPSDAKPPPGSSPPPPPSPPPPGPAFILPPSLPAPPHITGPVTARGNVYGNMDTAHISYALNAVISDGSSTFVIATADSVSLELRGFDFALDASGHLAGGTATAITYSFGPALGGPFFFNMDVIPPTPLITLANWALADATQTMFASMLGGNDVINGGPGITDVLRGYAGDDILNGQGGNDTIWGGAGNDIIFALGGSAPLGSWSTYLRGEEGDDYIIGGNGFDDINGNQGADTISGGPGNDWVVGGKDNDFQFGDFGDDIVWGNLGNDTLEGGDGADQVRGGQGDDLVFGNAGNDYVSGDRGNDTVTGGSGADIFHSFSGAGIDQVQDFSVSEGDRVMLDPGTTYTVTQVGADTVIDMGNGDKVILLGVQMSTLPAGTIFLG